MGERRDFFLSKVLMVVVFFFIEIVIYDPATLIMSKSMILTN